MFFFIPADFINNISYYIIVLYTLLNYEKEFDYGVRQPLQQKGIGYVDLEVLDGVVSCWRRQRMPETDWVQENYYS